MLVNCSEHLAMNNANCGTMLHMALPVLLQSVAIVNKRGEQIE
jgi:hypothetical protein